eukprot:1768200-Prymnesium_polylepis.1
MSTVDIESSRPPPLPPPPLPPPPLAPPLLSPPPLLPPSTKITGSTVIGAPGSSGGLGTIGGNGGSAGGPGHRTFISGALIQRFPLTRRDHRCPLARPPTGQPTLRSRDASAMRPSQVSE